MLFSGTCSGSQVSAKTKLILAKLHVAFSAIDVHVPWRLRRKNEAFHEQITFGV